MNIQILNIAECEYINFKYHCSKNHITVNLSQNPQNPSGHTSPRTQLAHSSWHFPKQLWSPLPSVFNYTSISLNDSKCLTDVVTLMLGKSQRLHMQGPVTTVAEDTVGLLRAAFPLDGAQPQLSPCFPSHLRKSLTKEGTCCRKGQNSWIPVPEVKGRACGD